MKAMCVSSTASRVPSSTAARTHLATVRRAPPLPPSLAARQLLSGLHDLAAAHAGAGVRDVRGAGLMVGLELARPAPGGKCRPVGPGSGDSAPSAGLMACRAHEAAPTGPGGHPESLGGLRRPPQLTPDRTKGEDLALSTSRPRQRGAVAARLQGARAAAPHHVCLRGAPIHPAADGQRHGDRRGARHRRRSAARGGRPQLLTGRAWTAPAARAGLRPFDRLRSERCARRAARGGNQRR